MGSLHLGLNYLFFLQAIGFFLINVLQHHSLKISVCFHSVFRAMSSSVIIFLPEMAFYFIIIVALLANLSLGN